MPITETMRKSFKALRLSSMLEEYERLADDPGVKGWSVDEYLEQLLSHELSTREQRAIEKPERVGQDSGLGLRLVRQRLDALYGDRASVRIDTGEGRGFAVELRLPLCFAHGEAAALLEAERTDGA